MTDAEREELKRLEVWKMAAKTRELEIGWFWMRSNYLLVLNTAIVGGLLLLDEDRHDMAVSISAVGMGVSWVWLQVNLGGKFWQARWEQRARIAELQYAPSARLFAADWRTIIGDTWQNVRDIRPVEGWWDYPVYGLRWLHRRMIMSRPSVTEMVTLLSVIFYAFWTFQLLWHWRQWDWTLAN